MEALNQIETSVDAVFAPCGGGGLLSGTVVAVKGFKKSIVVVGSEPALANDAARSLNEGKIFRWKKSPETLADGAKTLSVTQRTLQYLKRLDVFHEISEKEITYWTQWISHSLKLHIEPTAALGMASAYRWLNEQSSKKTVVVILSGGNMDQKAINSIWSKDHLIKVPSKALSF